MIVTTYNGQKIDNPRHEQVSGALIAASCAVRVIDSVDGVMAMFGIINVMPGVGHVWGSVSEKAAGHGLALARAMKKAMKDMHEEARTARIHRLQTYVDPRCSEDVRWIESLGFQVESVMAGGRPDGGDFLVYTVWR